jgi:hypothetical protein
MTDTPFNIRNDYELSLALLRAEELTGSTNGSEQKRELEGIGRAIEVYTDCMRVLRMVDANPHQTSPFASRD